MGSAPLSPLALETVEAEAIISGIMRRYGVRCSLEEFHSVLNVTFHDFESEVYDREHSDLWKSLPLQFSLLIQDCLASWPDIPASLRLLDIGCGTGLASECILNTAVGTRVNSAALVDTSPAMLRRASERASRWNIASVCHLGTIESLPPGARYDLIVMCSVLHHIPNLPRFLHAVRDHQAAGGVFLHVHDPNADYSDDAELRQRKARLSRRLPGWASASLPTRVLGRVYRAVTGAQRQDYIWRTNRALLDKGIITTPLSVEDLFAITDIHVNKRVGISVKRIQSWMPEYDCVSVRSYDFFGRALSSLSRRHRKLEEDLIGKRAPNGAEVGAAWKLKR